MKHVYQEWSRANRYLVAPVANQFVMPYPAMCERVILWKKGFCWTACAGWGMEQEEVCSLCQQRNFDLFVNTAREP